METITLLPVIHRNAEQILIKCPNVRTLNDAIKKITGAQWSQTHKAWYLPLNKQNYELIHLALYKLATINVDVLRTYQLKKKMSG